MATVKCELCAREIPKFQRWCCFEHAQVILARMVKVRPAPPHRRRWPVKAKP
jgi:hypothetical protein